MFACQGDKQILVSSTLKYFIQLYLYIFKYSVGSEMFACRGDKQILVSSTLKYFLRILVFDWYTGGKKNINIELFFNSFIVSIFWLLCFPVTDSQSEEW